MKSIILAAGYGTRLYPLTKERAKPLLPIRGKPIIEYIVRKIEHIEHVDEIFVVSNHRFYAQFKEWLDNFVANVPIHIIDDGSTNPNNRLGAIKDLALVLDQYAVNDDILVAGGDNVFSFSLKEFIDTAKTRKEHTYIGLFNMNGRLKAKKYGMVALDREGRVSAFYEKPEKLNGAKLVSMCLYYLPKEKVNWIQQYIQQGLNLDQIGSYFQWLIEKDPVYGHVFDGEWFDIGDIDSYTEAVCSF
ncbi:MAG: nucleotidyltransferase family protein [Candidatus Omnitrophica bacterium]|nr:nucleotidyltransferase family protein [Candidatus Omnitrophota bacterium]